MLLAVFYGYAQAIISLKSHQSYNGNDGYKPEWRTRNREFGVTLLHIAVK